MHCALHIALRRTVGNWSQADQETKTTEQRPGVLCCVPPFLLSYTVHQGRTFPGVLPKDTSQQPVVDLYNAEYTPSPNSAYSDSPGLCNAFHNACEMKQLLLLLTF